MLDAAPPGPLALLTYATALLAVCTLIHALTLVGLGRRLLGAERRPRTGFLADLRVVVGVTWALMLVHLIEIGIWAAFYLWNGCLPDHTTAFYFSSVTYLTVGYGDVVLPPEWRNLSSAEALTGILMAGLSSAFLFALFLRRFGATQHAPK
jgi:hypothetical protein